MDFILKTAKRKLSLHENSFVKATAPSFLSSLHFHLMIAIYAPTRGATLPWSFCDLLLHNFNPRSHEGSDAFVPPFFSASENFNPRSHEGSDNYDVKI